MLNTHSYIPNEKYESKEILDLFSLMEKVLDILEKRGYERWIDSFGDTHQNKSGGYFDNYFLHSWLRSRKSLVGLSSFSYQPYMELVQKFLDLFQVGSSLFSPQLDQISQDFGIDRGELRDGLLQKMIYLFRQSWEKIEKNEPINMQQLDFQAQQMAFLFGKMKSQVPDISQIPFFSYQPHILLNKNDVINDAFYKKMVHLYELNYADKPEFLEKIKEVFSQKVSTGNLELKGFFWDKTGEIDFEKNSENMIGFLYFSSHKNASGEVIPDAKYLGGVNIDPNFQKSGISGFIKKAIQEQFSQGVKEIYLDAVSFSQAEDMWRKIGFECQGIEKFLDTKDYKSIWLSRYVLTRERFNQVFSKSL